MKKETMVISVIINSLMLVLEKKISAFPDLEKK